MGIRTIEYVAAFQLEGEHMFAFKRLGGLFIDTLEIFIDEQQVLTTHAASWMRGTHKHNSTVDDHLTVNLRQTWAMGYPLD